MIIPIRCFSCGKLIGDKYERYLELKEANTPIEQIWEELGITRFCCKRMLVGHVNLIDDILNFNRLQ